MASGQSKIGAGSFAAWARLGLRELRAVFFPESNVAQPSEYGIWGTLTPGEVAAGRSPDTHAQRLDQEPAVGGGRHSPSPSAIAAGLSRGATGREHGGQHHAGPAGHSPGHGPGHEHGHEHEHGHSI